MTYRRSRMARWRCWRRRLPAPCGASIAAGLRGVTVTSVVRKACYPEGRKTAIPSATSARHRRRAARREGESGSSANSSMCDIL
jgi:hypothetical protein